MFFKDCTTGSVRVFLLYFTGQTKWYSKECLVMTFMDVFAHRQMLPPLGTNPAPEVRGISE